MKTALIPIFVTFILFFVFMLFHILVWRMESLRSKGVVLLCKLAATVYITGIIIMGFMFPFSWPQYFWLTTALFALLLMLYLHFYVGMDRSVSIRLLGELMKASKHELSLKKIEALYPKGYMIKHRVDTLVQTGWLAEKNGQYHCLSKGILFAKSAIFLKNLFLLEKTG